MSKYTAKLLGPLAMGNGKRRALRIKSPPTDGAGLHLPVTMPTTNSPLIVFAGLPGVGKTTLARRLAERLGAVYLRIDTIEGALLKCGMSVTVEGYAVAYGLAEDNLKLGLGVVVDGCNPVRETREAWRSISAQQGVRHVDIEVVCSNTEEHRQRVESRLSLTQKHHNPTWAEVQSREYEDWTWPRWSIDTAGRPNETLVDELQEKLSGTE